ncbi:hypothetical protein L9F63_008240, partial [Diploptera punctata]
SWSITLALSSAESPFSQTIKSKNEKRIFVPSTDRIRNLYRYVTKNLAKPYLKSNNSAFDIFQPVNVLCPDIKEVDNKMYSLFLKLLIINHSLITNTVRNIINPMNIRQLILPPNMV